jgi:3-keto-disaccharide hydrolase
VKRQFRAFIIVATTSICHAQCAWTFISLATTANGEEFNKPPAGFTALFNGRDFDDWTGASTRDPREIKAMNEEERAAHDAKMKEGIHKRWHVEDGMLVSDGHEPYLATKREFGDFEMWVDWLIGPKGDSGIYLRGAPQVQIWDPTNPGSFKNGNQKGSGALWNNKNHERWPLERADRPVGEWNRMYIRMIGPYVSVILNDKPVVKNVVMENYYDKTIPMFARGPIYLQTHGSETRFRNVFIREIPAEEADRALAEIGGGEQGFRSVFNGKDLSGWIGAVDSFDVVDGAIQCKSGHGGNLLTKDEYDNFVARLEFKLPPGGNNGLAIRASSPNGDMAYDAAEIQVLDDSADQYKDLHEYQYNGSLYGLAPATRGYLRPVGEWNYEEVMVDGNHVSVRLNGFEILNADLAKLREKPADGKKHPGASRTSGHFGFCGHNEPVAFRNIRIKRLDAKPPTKG